MAGETELPIYIRVSGVEQAKEAIKSITEGGGEGHGLEGSKKHVEELGKGAEETGKAFETLKGSIEGATGVLAGEGFAAGATAFRGIGEAVAEAAEGLGAFGVAAVAVGGVVGGIAAVVGTAAVGLYEIGEKATETVIAFENLVEMTGMSGEKIAAMQRAFEHAGLDANALGRVLTVVSREVQTEWGGIVKAVRDGADELEKAVLKVSDAQRALSAAQDKASAAPRKVREAQAGVDHAEDALKAEDRSVTTDELALAKEKIALAKLEGKSVSSADVAHVNDLEKQAKRENIERLEERISGHGQRRAELIDKRDDAVDAVHQAKLGEKAAIDGVIKATIALTEAMNAQKDVIAKHPDILAEALKEPGTGKRPHEAAEPTVAEKLAKANIDIAKTEPKDIERALIYAGAKTTPDGRPTTESTLAQIHAFEADEGIPDAAKTAIVAKYGRGPDRVKLRKAFADKEVLTPDDEDREYARLMALAHPAAEEAERSRGDRERKTAEAGVVAASANDFAGFKLNAAANQGMGNIALGLARGMDSGEQAVESELSRLGSALRSATSRLDAMSNTSKGPSGLPEERGDTVSSAARKIADAVQAALAGRTAASGEEKKAEGGGEEKKAEGGMISGPGGPTSDSVPIWASHGEFVIKADRTSALGSADLHALNNGDASIIRHGVGMAEGGEVSEAAFIISNAVSTSDAPDDVKSAIGAKLAANPSLAGQLAGYIKKLEKSGVAVDITTLQSAVTAVVEAQALRQFYGKDVQLTGLAKEIAPMVGGFKDGGSVRWRHRADGGEISGPGGPREDRVPIWASNGEFIINAGRASQLGSSDLHALNRGEASIAHHAGGARYASGGLVGGGGDGSGGHHVLDLRTDGGAFPVRASENVVRSIKQSSISSRISTTGVRPSWQG